MCRHYMVIFICARPGCMLPTGHEKLEPGPTECLRWLTYGYCSNRGPRDRPERKDKMKKSGYLLCSVHGSNKVTSNDDCYLADDDGGEVLEFDNLRRKGRREPDAKCEGSRSNIVSTSPSSLDSKHNTKDRPLYLPENPKDSQNSPPRRARNDQDVNRQPQKHHKYLSTIFEEDNEDNFQERTGRRGRRYGF